MQQSGYFDFRGSVVGIAAGEALRRGRWVHRGHSAEFRARRCPRAPAADLAAPMPRTLGGGRCVGGAVAASSTSRCARCARGCLRRRRCAAVLGDGSSRVQPRGQDLDQYRAGAAAAIILLMTMVMITAVAIAMSANAARWRCDRNAGAATRGDVGKILSQCGGIRLCEDAGFRWSRRGLCSTCRSTGAGWRSSSGSTSSSWSTWRWGS